MTIPAPLADYDAQYTQPVRELLFKTANYLTTEERDLLERACAYAFVAHRTDVRKSGEPYITHPIAVTIELAKWGMDIETLCAGLMHDVLEDTDVTKEEMAGIFGSVITNMVDGLSKLEKLEFDDKHKHFAASFQKLILAMTRDIRIIVVKLSDRLHNMRTLDGVPEPEKRRSTARETLEVHAPLALRLGMNQVYRELQDIAFQNLSPTRYAIIRQAVEGYRTRYRVTIEKALSKLETSLQENNIQATVKLAPVNLYSVYQKMKKRKLHFRDITDVLHVHVITTSESDCYVALGALHRAYKPQMGKIKDLIAVPNANNYQSLHTVLKVPHSKREHLELSVQVRTEEMDNIASYGITAVSPNSEHYLRTNRWLQTVSDLHESSTDAMEFLEHMKNDLFPVDTYVFTPKGEIINLPRGATLVDFAYYVHTKVGNRCVAGKVNGQLVPLRTKVRSGTTVEIITSEYAHPSPTWLSFITTARARSGIKAYMKNSNRQAAIEHGGALLAKTLNSLLPKKVASSPEVMDNYLKKLEEDKLSLDDVKFQIGSGQLLAITVAKEIAALAGEQFGQDTKLDTVLVYQHDSVRIHLAKCCRPIMGDAVHGVIVAGEGLMVHRDICPTLLKSDPDSQINVDWGSVAHLKVDYEVTLRVQSQDGHGLLGKLSTTISNVSTSVNITSVETLSKAESSHGFMEFLFTIKLDNLAQLNEIMSRLKQIGQVREVLRV